MNLLSKSIFSLALVFTVCFLSSCEKEVIQPEPQVSEDIVLNEEVTEDRFLELLDIAEEKAMAEGSSRQWAFDGEFEINYDENVTIGVGGAVYNHTSNQWLSGGAAGNVHVSPAVFRALQGSLSSHVRIQVQHSWFFLRQVKITFLDKANESHYGLYNANNGDYLFFGLNGAGGEIGTTPCGVIALGALSGRLNGDQLTLNNGQFGMGFIAGCSPLFVGANINFYYEGVRIP